MRHLIPFFVTRQVVCGAGRVGLGVDSRGAGYQISQRADFFETEVGLETTLKRPIINTRDEPHAVADRYRRLHVIIGDANLLDVATLLKVGTTSLVLGMIEDGHLTEDWSIRRPVAALQTVSHDPGLTATVELVDGRSDDGARRAVALPRGRAPLARPARRRPGARGHGRGDGPLGGRAHAARAATSCRAPGCSTG